MSCGVGRRRGSDPVLLWLWYRLVATAPIGPFTWDPPHATGVALEKAKRQKYHKKKLLCEKVFHSVAISAHVVIEHLLCVGYYSRRSGQSREPDTVIPLSWILCSRMRD